MLFFVLRDVDAKIKCEMQIGGAVVSNEVVR